MTDKTGGNRNLRRAGALAAAAAAAVLVTACGSGPSAGSTAANGPDSVGQELALAQCMRSHGVPGFPDPSGSGGFTLTTTPGGPAGSVDIDSHAVQAAYGACRHLLADGGPSIGSLQQKLQQARQGQAQNLPALLKFSQCMRSNGVPGFPDPPGSGATAPAAAGGAAISPSSPQFQTALRDCRPLLPPGFNISVGTHAQKATG